tara:strand:+ start:139 stop:333 length:195 start_codon:yes stop_codon:yes gene_type:complete
MSQQETYEFLKRNSNKWYSAEQISLELGHSTNAVRTNLMKLRRTEWIEFKDGVVGKKPYLYRYI